MTEFSPTPFLKNGFWHIGYGTSFYEDGRCVLEHDEAISEERGKELLLLKEKYGQRILKVTM